MRGEDRGFLTLQMETAALRLDYQAVRNSLLATKREGRNSERSRFIARLNAEAQANSRILLSTLRALDLSPRDLPDIAEAQADALAAWDRQARHVAADRREEPQHRAAALHLLEDDLARRFTSRINAERQQALGMDRYIWRSRDDALVRPLHAAHDDRIFFWDEPPEGGHPGEAYNCRCFAEPVLLDEPDWRPTVDGSYGRAIDRAILEGAFDAAVDFVSDFVPSVDDLWALLDALAELAEVAGEASELAALVVRDALVGLDERDSARRDALIGDAGTWAGGLATALVDAPALARGLLAYVRALEARPSTLDRAYRRGLATRSDVEDAYRERSYARTSAALYGLATALSARAAARGLTARLLRRFGRRTDLGDDAAGISLSSLARRARALSPVADWRRIDNPGIEWGKGIKDQANRGSDIWRSVASSATGSKSMRRTSRPSTSSTKPLVWRPARKHSTRWRLAMCGRHGVFLVHWKATSIGSTDLSNIGLANTTFALAQLSVVALNWRFLSNRIQRRSTNSTVPVPMPTNSALRWR